MISTVVNDCRKYYFPPSLAFLGEKTEIRHNGDNNEKPNTTAMDLELTNRTTAISPMRPPSNNNGDDEEDKEDLSLRSSVISDDIDRVADLITWKGILQTNRQLYDIACWTGIIYPVPSKKKNIISGLTDKQIVFRQRWTILTHIALLLLIANIFAIVPFIFLAPYYRHNTDDQFSTDSSLRNKIYLYLLFSMIAGYLPMITMVGGMIALRKSIVNEVPLFHPSLVGHNVSGASSSSSQAKNQQLLEMDCVVIIQQCIAQKLPLAWKLIRFFVTLTSLYVFFLLVYLGFAMSSDADDNMEGQTAAYKAFYLLSMIFYLASLPGFLPYVLTIIGLLSFVIIEQRVSYFRMLHLRSLAMQSLLTDTEYLLAGNDMKYRDSISPLNWLIVGAGVDSGVCIIILCIIAFAKGVTIQDSMQTIEIVALVFCQQLTILLLILYEILCVNEMIDVLLLQTTKQRAIDHNRRMITFQTYELTKDSSTNGDKALLIELLKEEEKRVRRLELYLLVKEQRIGTTILFVYRPSKAQLMVQITSIVIALLSSLMKLIVNAITNQ